MRNPPYSKDKNFKAQLSASCFCGAVKYEIGGEPTDAMYCHCKDCQRLHGAPFQWAAVFHKEDIFFATGHDSLIFYHSSTNESKHELPCKVSCNLCHSPIADEGRNMMLMFPEFIHFKDDKVPEEYMGSHHMLYGFRVMDINDGKDKWLGKKGDRQVDDGGHPLKRKADAHPTRPAKHEKSQ